MDIFKTNFFSRICNIKEQREYNLTGQNQCFTELCFVYLIVG